MQIMHTRHVIKIIGFLLLWLAGSTAAVAVAWTGVSIVDDELIDPAPANIQIAGGASVASAATTPDPGPAPTSSPTSTTVTDPTATSAPGSNALTSPEISADSSAPAATQSAVAPTEAPTADPSSTTAPPPTTSATPPTSSTTAAPTSTTAASTSTTAPSQTLTFNLVGGSTAISFSSTGVDVLWATPNPGFTVQIVPESPGIKVEFEADHHESRIDAWWAGGPRHEIREKPDD